jgi:hypothetical protein
MRYLRKLQYKNFALWAAVVLAAVLDAAPSSAVERVYTLDPNQSSIAISGSVRTSAGTSQIQSQGPGSLTSDYSGTIRSDRANNTIQFLAGSSIDATVSGNWQPLATGAAGSAAADYGGRVSFLFGIVTINFAARDFVGDLSSGPLPIDVNGDFSLSTTTVSFLNGNLAYRSTTGDAGSESVVGESGTMSGTGSLTTQTRTEGVFEILSIPINSSFMIPVEDSTTVNLQLMGELVATAMLPDDLPGDFNQNGTVDAADYVVWRNGLGTTHTPADYDLWRAHFGQSAGIGAAGYPSGASAELLSASVPEPSALVLLAMAIVVAFGRRRATVTT